MLLLGMGVLTSCLSHEFLDIVSVHAFRTYSLVRQCDVWLWTRHLLQLCAAVYLSVQVEHRKQRCFELSFFFLSVNMTSAVIKSEPSCLATRGLIAEKLETCRLESNRKCEVSRGEWNIYLDGVQEAKQAGVNGF